MSGTHWDLAGALSARALMGAGAQSNISKATPPSVTAYDPTAPYATAQGLVQAPNIDLNQQVVGMMTASDSFSANIAVLKTNDQMQQSLLNSAA